MKQSLLIRAVGLVLSCVVLGCTTKKVLKFSPVLTNDFGHVVTVDGKLCNGMVLGYKYKGAEEDNFIFVERIEGDKVGKVERIAVVGVNQEISGQLMRCASESKETRLIGCEYLEPRGIPNELLEYLDNVPQCQDWHFRRIFLVVKCDVIKMADKGRECAAE